MILTPLNNLKDLINYLLNVAGMMNRIYHTEMTDIMHKLCQENHKRIMNKSDFSTFIHDLKYLLNDDENSVVYYKLLSYILNKIETIDDLKTP